jgi:hypothetical protein
MSDSDSVIKVQRPKIIKGDPYSRREYMRVYVREQNKEVYRNREMLLEEFKKFEIPWINKCKFSVNGGFTISKLSDLEMYDLVTAYVANHHQKTDAEEQTQDLINSIPKMLSLKKKV